MGQITVSIPKTYFTALNRVATVSEWKDSHNDCCEVTIPGISDPGELIMLGVKMAKYLPPVYDYNEQSKRNF